MFKVPTTSSSRTQRAVPATPFRVLDAPRLRDDFYCSTLAYCDTTRTLAVGLSPRVYLWSEEGGVRFPPLIATSPTDYVTSLSFSSTKGGKSILAVGRLSGQILLWSTFEMGVRFEAQQPNPVSCLAFSPYVTMRPSELMPEDYVPCEDLLVGDDMGNIFYYTVEWPDDTQLRMYPQWTGALTLLAKITAHSQQICGLSWSPDRKHFATGGNDNLALLFEISEVLVDEETPTSPSLRSNLDYENLLPAITAPPSSPVARRRSHLARLFNRARDPSPSRSPPHLRQIRSFSPTDHDHGLHSLPTPPDSPQIPTLPMTRTFHYLHSRAVDPTSSIATYSTLIPSHALNTIQKHTFPHSAAVKALAFPLWQSTLLATGGGSNDRAIHFFHTGSGATLATISVHAQVTSLIWSKTRREICATFGYAQPEHGIRIAVFAWPSGECVVSIPWGDGGNGLGVGVNGGAGGRALWAVAYPGGPNDGSTSSRTRARRRMDGRRRGVGEGSGEERARGPLRRGVVRRGNGDGEGGTWWSRTEQEGCIIVASSDESVKFHEVWAGSLRASHRSRGMRGPGSGGGAVGIGLGLGSKSGVLGGSDILEGVCEGIDILEEGQGIR